jgi:hypothetical protein
MLTKPVFLKKTVGLDAGFAASSRNMRNAEE